MTTGFGTVNKDMGGPFSHAVSFDDQTEFGGPYQHSIFTLPGFAFGGPYPISGGILTAQAGIHGIQLDEKTIDTDKIADDLLSVSVLGRNMMSDGFLGNDQNSRDLIADDFITAAKLDRTYQTEISTAYLDWTDKFHETDEVAPLPVEVSEESAISFENGVDQEAKVSFAVPAIWDEVNALTYTMTISPSTSLAATFDLSLEMIINGSTAAITNTVSVTPSTTADTQTETVVVFTINTPQISKNDRIVLKIKRLGSTDAHTGDMRVYDVRQKTLIKQR